MIGRTVIISRELLQADRIVVGTDTDIKIHIVPDPREEIGFYPLQGVLIYPDILIPDQYLMVFRLAGPQAPGILRIDRIAGIPLVVPGVPGRPDIGMKRQVELPPKVDTGRKSDIRQVGILPVA